MSSRPQCKHRRRNGQRCKAYACGDGQFCFFHSPELTPERTKAQRAGGTTRGRQNAAIAMTEIPERQLRNTADVCELLSTTINEVRSGKVQPRIATAVGYLANILLGALEQGPLEDRLLALEAVLGLPNGRSKESAAHAEKSLTRQN
jgi:hypothetical protein